MPSACSALSLTGHLLVIPCLLECQPRGPVVKKEKEGGGAGGRDGAGGGDGARKQGTLRDGGWRRFKLISSKLVIAISSLKISCNTMYSSVPKNKPINYTVIASADNKLAVIKGMTVGQ